MDRWALLLFVGLVVVLGGVGVGAASGSYSQVVTDTDSLDIPHRLSLGSTPAAGTTVPSPDLGTTAYTAATTTHDQYRVLLLEEQLDRATTAADRQALLANESQALQNRTTTLRAQERDAYQRYTAGELTEQQLVSRLALTSGEARGVSQRLQVLFEAIETTEGITVTSDLRGARVETATVRTPLREQLVAIVAGADQPQSVAVAATDRGLGVATIDDGTYHAESYYGPARGTANEVSFSFGEVETQVTDLYPWLTPARISVISAPAELGEAIWVVQGSDDTASLTVYFDERTQEIYLEEQRLQPDAISTIPAVQTVDNGLELRINRTHPGGPARVQVIDTRTGSPADATITIEDYQQVQQSEDGVWIVAPYTQTTVTATVDGRTVNATTDWGAET